MMKRISFMLFAVGMLVACSNRGFNHELHPVGFEASAVGGELAERINKNFDRMESELYHPVKVFWTEAESGGWPADKEGRTILALVLDAKASGREPVYLQRLIDMLPNHLNEKGYMGTIHSCVDEQQLSGHGWLLRALCEHYEWKQDKKALEIARGIVDGLFLPVKERVADYPIKPEERISNAGGMSGHQLNEVNGWRLSSDIGCVFIGMEGLIHYYKHDRDPQIKAVIDELIALFLNIDLVGIKAQTHASLTALRGLMRYETIVGNSNLLPDIEKRWQLYEQYGMTENYENFNWFGRYDTWTEPCAIIDSYLLAVQLWAKTLNPHYIEMAEKIYFNGMCVTQRANGGFGCDVPVGPVYHDIGMHAYEAHWCCTMRGGEGLGRAADYAYFRKGNNIYVPFYRENQLEMEDFAMAQNTDYPFGSSVEFLVTKPAGKNMKLHLVMPSYMKESRLSLNNEPLMMDMKDGFAVVERKFKQGDILRLDYLFERKAVPSATVEGMRKIVYGPLVEGINPENNECAPLYHLLDPKVSGESGWKRKVIE